MKYTEYPDLANSLARKYPALLGKYLSETKQIKKTQESFDKNSKDMIESIRILGLEAVEDLFFKAATGREKHHKKK